MKKLAVCGSALALALLLAFATSFGFGGTTVAFAQDATPVPTIVAQTQPAQPVQDDNEFPWGLLGLIGLAGLIPRRREEPVRVETTRTTPGVGVRDTKN